MKPHFRTKAGDDDPDLERLLGILVYIAKGYDPNGVDVHFMINKRHDIKNCKKTRDVKMALQKCEFKGSADFGACIQLHLRDYGERLEEHFARNRPRSKGRSRYSLSSESRLRPVTFYILTNGVWVPGEQAGQEAIVNLCQLLERLNRRKGQVGIQFISFGSDSAGLKRLQALDELNKAHNLSL